MTARIIWIGKNNEMAVVPRSASSAGMSAAARPVVLPRAGRAAPTFAHKFDATAERWIVPPSGVTPDAGAAADLRHSDETPCLESPAASLAPTAAGHLEAISEVLKMAVGLTVFGLVAGVFLVIA